jgi:transposase
MLHAGLDLSRNRIDVCLLSAAHALWRNKKRLGKQRGAKVARIDIARKLTEAIWHMLTRNQPFAPTPAPGGAAFRLAA